MIVKICGITGVDDAALARDAGADWIGINLWPGSKRFVEPARAQAIADAAVGLVRVAVLVNATAAVVEQALAWADLLQFHGDETPETCAPYAGRFIRALPFTAIDTLDRYSTDLFLLDTPTAGYGGSGRTYDFGLATAAARKWRVLVAGGLTPENVGAAVRAVRPFGVDVASGVEAAPGRKDPDKLRRFVAAAKEMT
jgi:phosphoribosylanthranilate isomerase